MFNLAVTFIAAALLAPSAAVGQTLTPCVANCSTIAAQAAGCTALTDFACVCTNSAFLESATACITADCPGDLAAAAQTQTETCLQYAANQTESVSDGTGSTSAAGTGSTTAAGSTTRTSSSTSRPATTAGASTTPASTTSRSAGFHTATIASGVGLALFGAAFSLF